MLPTSSDMLVGVLSLLDARDWMRLRAADPRSFDCMMGELVSEARFTYTACRILSEPEIRWFERRGVPVRLLVNHVEDKFAERWYQNGKLHRDGELPAVVWADGSQFWYSDGKKHRDGDRPAVLWADGTQEWYRYGQKHRDGDQPAFIGANGSQAWYRDGKLHRDGDLPAEVWANGSRFWYLDGKLHRDGDLPAIIGVGRPWYSFLRGWAGDGWQSWMQNGLLHRDGGRPAVIGPNGRQEWYLVGQKINLITNF